MNTIHFDQERCRQDGICGQVCPTKHIIAEPGSFPYIRDNSQCIHCGQCLAFCPHNAITIDGLPQELATPLKNMSLPTETQLTHLLQSRRSIRLYKKDIIPKELLNRLLEIAAYAPTAKNIRSLRFIVVYQSEEMQKLGNCLADCLEQNAKTDHPIIAEGLYLARAWRRGEDALFRGAPHLISSVAPRDWFWKLEDCTICQTYLELAAYAHGLGSCWAGYAIAAAGAFPEVRALLGIQEDECLGGMQMIGYPRLKQFRAAPRLPYPCTWI